MKNLAISSLLLTAAALLAGGCTIMDEILAMQAADSVDLAQNESALSSTALEGVDEQTSPEEAAQISVENLGLFYKPAGCAVGTIDPVAPNKVSWEVTDCTGPYGFVTINGTVEVVYSSIADGIRAEYSGTGVHFNQAVMDIDAVSDLTFDGATRHRKVTTHSSGTGARGNQIDREGEYDIDWDWDARCLGIAGTWKSKVDDRSWTTTVTDWHRCEGACPDAGGQIEFKGGIRKVTVTLDYDGSDLVDWKSSRGSSGSIQLNCGDK